MKALEDKILQEGEILPGEVVKLGSFLNQQIDVELTMEMGREVARLFDGKPITKVLTLEASGIAFAFAIASVLHVPMVFAKKSRTSNTSGEMYSTVIHSYTHNVDNNVTVEKRYLKKEDKVLIADDFLASGNAFFGLLDLVKQSGAEVVGMTAEVEKCFQGGGDKLRAMGYQVESMAVIGNIENGVITFRH